MKKLLLVLLLVPLVSFGQDDGYELCFELRNRSFSTNEDATKALQKILSVANLKTNRFVILPCDNIGNAMAAVYEGFRYILYKESWIDKSDYWSKMAILAHEVGHHINGHTLSGYSLADSKRVELEADDWAGYAMGVLGASLTQTLELTKRFPDGDDSNSTHPNRAKRINALTVGWNIGSKKGTVYNAPSESIKPTPTTTNKPSDNWKYNYWKFSDFELDVYMGKKDKYGNDLDCEKFYQMIRYDGYRLSSDIDYVWRSFYDEIYTYTATYYTFEGRLYIFWKSDDDYSLYGGWNYSKELVMELSQSWKEAKNFNNFRRDHLMGAKITIGYSNCNDG